MDHISFVNAAWLEWAHQNDGETVTPERVLGRSLWTCVADSTVRQIYHRLVKLARLGKPVRFNYRCDSPKSRRVFEMIIRLADGREVEFSSTLVQQEDRPSVALLETWRTRDERMVRICSWCQRVAMPDGQWLPVEEAIQVLHLLDADPFPRITHGMCGQCRLSMSETG